MDDPWDDSELTRRFRESAATTSNRAPLYRALSSGIADDPDLVRLLRHAPVEQQLPVLLFASAHYPAARRTRQRARAVVPEPHGRPPVARRSGVDAGVQAVRRRPRPGPGRPARHAEDPDQRGRTVRLLPAGAGADRRRGGPARPPRRRRERRPQPPARPVRVPLRATSRCATRRRAVHVVGGPSDVVLDVTTRGPRPGARPRCRRSAPVSGSTATRST